MPEKWTVQSAREKRIGETPCWRVVMLRADGKPHAHTMPVAALDRYAAEYGIDPDDTDGLLEILLHEPHMALTEETEDHPPRYADTGTTLWEADSTHAAREAHLDRVKNCPVRIDVRSAPALDVIRSTRTPDRERIRAMREAIDTARWAKLYGDLPIRPNLEEAIRA